MSAGSDTPLAERPRPLVAAGGDRRDPTEAAARDRAESRRLCPLYAHLFDLLGDGRVVTVDVERPPRPVPSVRTDSLGQFGRGVGSRDDTRSSARRRRPGGGRARQRSWRCVRDRRAPSVSRLVTRDSLLLVQDGVIDVLPRARNVRPEPWEPWRSSWRRVLISRSTGVGPPLPCHSLPIRLAPSPLTSKASLRSDPCSRAAQAVDLRQSRRSSARLPPELLASDRSRPGSAHLPPRGADRGGRARGR
jgi:hypothetical protein